MIEISMLPLRKNTQGHPYHVTGSSYQQVET